MSPVLCVLIDWYRRTTRENIYRRTWRGKLWNPQTSKEQKATELLEGQSWKTLSPFSICSITRWDKYVNLLWHRRRIFFLCALSVVSSVVRLRSSPCVLGIRKGSEEGRSPFSKTTPSMTITETPAALWVLVVFVVSLCPTLRDRTFGTREWNDR